MIMVIIVILLIYCVLCVYLYVHLYRQIVTPIPPSFVCRRSFVLFSLASSPATFLGKVRGPDYI